MTNIFMKQKFSKISIKQILKVSIWQSMYWKSFPLLLPLRGESCVGTDFGRTHSQFYLASLGATHKGALIAALVPNTSLSIVLKIPKF